MKQQIILGLALIFSLVSAQSVETTFVIQDTKDGEQVIDVIYNEVEVGEKIDPFAEADKNSDGCLDRQEARDMGILNFDRFALTNKQCLNEEEYNAAIHATD